MKKFIYACLAVAIFVSGISGALAQSTNFGFAPVGDTQTLSVTNSSSNVTLNSSPGSAVLLQNTGTATAFVKCGTTAATTDMPLQSGWSIFISCPPGSKVAAITASSTATVYVTKGLGTTAISH